ncbi:MAG TPA: cytochrome b/b6 domain-containing protein [Anaerolineales bacterium]|nr:cytochrome b/b6 domain-containing protein [Anaerolineales bacterium]
MRKDISARYHPLQVSFHWLVVALLVAMFILGKYMSGLPNDTGKLLPLGIHIALGVITLIVIVARLIARFHLPQPARATTGYRFLDGVSKFVHYALYALVFLMVVSGISLSLQTGLFPIVFGGSGAALPADFYDFNARTLHGLVAPALAFLVLLHVGAALYHQFLLKDRLMARMWFEKKHDPI